MNAYKIHAKVEATAATYLTPLTVLATQVLSGLL